MSNRTKPALTAALMAAMAGPVFSGSPESDGPAYGQIVVEPSDSGYYVAALVTGLDDVPVMAELLIEKVDSAGSISTRQAREVTLAPGHTETVAQSTMSLTTNGQIEMTLTLSQNGVEFDRINRSIISGEIDPK